jgi:thiamine biosynthesis lipoprotein
MGTRVEIFLYAPDASRASELMEAAFEEIERVESALSNYRGTSELSRINAGAAEGPLVTDPEVFHLIERAFDHSRRTGGAFDITVGPLVEVWGFFRRDGRYPSPDELAEARAQTGWAQVVLDPSERSIRFLAPGSKLDLGGMGKGWALDCAGRVLGRLGVDAALLGIGQSSYLAIGAPPGSEGWLIKVPDPRDPSGALATVRLSDRSLSTSGSNEKYFELAGVRYGHVLDPRTGEPSSELVQATVLASTAADSDVLSTALLVLGPEGAAELLGGMKGPSALLVTKGQAESRVIAIGWPGQVANSGK